MTKSRNTVTQWRIHIGAHKTATTHVQDILAALRPDLATQGLDIIPTDPLRAGLEQQFRRRRTLLAGTGVMSWMLQRYFAQFRLGQPVVVISEENLLGPAVDLLASTPYPRLEDRLRILASLRKSAPVQFYLSIRSFDRVLPGAYATAMRFNYFRPRPMDKLRAGLHQNPPSWSAVIARIRAAAPDVPLRVWRQEDYAHHDRAILSEFLGTPLDSLPDLPRPTSTMTPSAEAIAAAEKLSRDVSPEDWNAQVEALYRQMPADQTHARYMPFDADDIALLKQRYAQDLQEIEAQWPGMLMTPAN